MLVTESTGTQVKCQYICLSVTAGNTQQAMFRMFVSLELCTLRTSELEWPRDIHLRHFTFSYHLGYVEPRTKNGILKTL